MKIAKWFLSAAGLIMLGFIVFVIIAEMNQPKRVYVNDSESILKELMSAEGRDYQSVEIIEIIDADAVRFVGFLADGHPGAATYLKNEDGNYVSDSKRIAYNVSRVQYIHHNPAYQMLVTNSNNKIATFQTNVNGEIFEQKLKPNANNVSVLKLPEADEYTFHWYKYYDADGQLIK